jgi:transposase
MDIGIAMKPKKVTVLRLKDILRLHHEARLSHRKIARSLGLSVGVISKYLTRARLAGIGWPLPPNTDEAQLLAILRPKRNGAATALLSEPDFAEMSVELSRKGMTRQLLWEEYAERHPKNHYSYSRFTVLYRAWFKKQRISMRQIHRAGEKLFVDYAGLTLKIIDSATGEERAAQVFVCVLGASSYTYAEATWTQRLPDWIGSHIRAFEFYDGVPEVVVPDNLKSAVSKACRYDPELNPSYAQLAAYYQTAVIPARPYKPQDKSKAEVGVQIVERWIMMRLRKLQLFGLAEANQAIRVLLDDLNNRPFKQRPGSRQSQFEAIDKPALKPLPSAPYAYRHVVKARAHIDYHVSYDSHHYSLPYRLRGEEVMVHAGEQTVAVFYQGKCVAEHPRSRTPSGHTTNTAHMPKAHAKHQEWTPSRFVNWAQSIGPTTQRVVRYQLESRPHPEHGYRACLGILSLAKKYGKDRLEAACLRAEKIGGLHYKNLLSILTTGLDKLPIETDKEQSLPATHANVRGADYYH